ncbi:hypothetical protein [Alkalicoccus halolimnae]|uniref:DUF3221 domain-containing protein n=1 Tax=Alkalicoccus halolimnae TaxID=1667239 RepID=A0A5C7FK33_9BACI|nr:hypothetical protein [Alkalicoccus halolimnae]TXF85155.1 hypothetical protein FTX54_10075 [Alkalicoccus halolimnae]
MGRLLFLFCILLNSSCSSFSFTSAEPERPPDLTGIIVELDVNRNRFMIEEESGENIWLSEHMNSEFRTGSGNDIAVEDLRTGMVLEIWLLEELMDTEPPMGSIEFLQVEQQEIK